jgi:hypothetical protein
VEEGEGPRGRAQAGAKRRPGTGSGAAPGRREAGGRDWVTGAPHRLRDFDPARASAPALPDSSPATSSSLGSADESTFAPTPNASAARVVPLAPADYLAASSSWPFSPSR